MDDRHTDPEAYAPQTHAPKRAYGVPSLVGSGILSLPVIVYLAGFERNTHGTWDGLGLVFMAAFMVIVFPVLWTGLFVVFHVVAWIADLLQRR